MLAWRGMAVLVGCQWAGQLAADTVHAPLPGPLIGMLLLLALLCVRGRAAGALLGGVQLAGGGLLRVLGFLYVPAGVGVITQIALLRTSGVALAAALAASAVLGLAVTGVAMQRLSRV